MQDSRVIYPALIKKYNLQGFMDVPIYSRDRKVIGVLYLNIFELDPNYKL